LERGRFARFVVFLRAGRPRSIIEKHLSSPRVAVTAMTGNQGFITLDSPIG
jgi:hypothetical protein